MNAVFGSFEKFDLTHAVYAREGSAFYLIENYYTHLLQLSSYKPNAWLNANPFLFTLRVFAGGQEQTYMYRGDPGSMVLTCPTGQIELIFTYDNYARILGKKGLSLRFEADTYTPGPNMSPAACHGICALPDGTTELTYGTYGKLRFRPLKGSVRVTAQQDRKGVYTSVAVELLPDENGDLDFAMHEAMIEFDGFPESYPAPDTLRQDGFDRLAAFSKFYKKPAKGFERLFDYAVHTVWARRVKPGAGSIYKYPMILMHYEYLGAAFAWQQALQGAIMQGAPEEGWKLICSLFDFQNEVTGQLPGNVGFLSYNAGGTQPPIQGFALDYLISKVGDSFLTPEECARMYPKFAKWAEFWATYRSAGRGDDVLSVDVPHDTGFDDATVYKDGFPTINPDLLSFMILLLEMTGRLAEGCGKTEEAEAYKARSKKLLQTLIDEFWDGDKFVVKHNGKPVDSMSLVCYLPIMLGKRLPQHIIDRIAEQLIEEGHFLTDIGLASESLRSPDSAWDHRTFVHGRVVAPMQAYICCGLNRAGKKKEAALIARRFAAHAQEKGCLLGFPPRTDIYPATGEPVYILPGPVASDGWPWSSWAAGACLYLITNIIPEGEEA